MRKAELTLDEMLSDIVVQLMMRRDGVTEAEVRALMAGLRRHKDELARSAQQNFLADAA